ncbi:hypothetical protein GWI33_008114 [Rhynchophorus ferrugineus]|uniref:E3 ubiquitin-protein ligase MARCHF6 n=1 Tax=Rhynchophorus ferrugineus TaxID=354439 RepID=A0A834IDC0_RHYFE|nr:hypothetical protein GWI33_008114 [Rhynchophorus ferrugineus]
MESELTNADICRVCRSEGGPERPLFHPCICTGSIKWIHQECLVQWMRYSRKEYCELCGHKFSFTPIYSPDMPGTLPVKDLASGLLSSMATAIKYWFHYSLVTIAWLGIVPLTACRIYRALFASTVDAILTLPFEIISSENIAADIFQGCFVVSCTLFAFAGLVWLREQILHGGGPEWLQRDDVAPVVENAPALRIPEDLNENEDDNGGAPADEGEVVPENQDQPEQEGNVGEDNNWIPMEWDRAAEEITWERLLGLDGSLMFLEHVFWVISLNTIFIIIFAYAPYHMGVLTLNLFNLQEYASESHFEGLLTTLIGYNTVGLCFLVLYRFSGWLNLFRAKRKLELFLWEQSFRTAPGTSIFLHWLIGMVYVYYFASFILLLREIVRPGVLWFLRNFNDPDFSPIQEMIHMPILEHIKKLIISAVIFGSAVLLMLWLPIRFIKLILPTFLPYTVSLSNETQVNELSLELLLLQVILPALLEQSHTRVWLKAFVRWWCKIIAWILDLQSYLLGDQSDNERDGDQNGERQENVPVNDGVNLGAVHQALFMMEPPTGYQPYQRPKLFLVRLFSLLVMVCFSLVCFSVVALTVPVWLGRRVMALWLVGAPPPGPQISATEAKTEVKVHELYTAACGLYLCWLAARAVTLVLSWLPQGRAAMMDRLKHWCMLGLKTIVASILLLGVVPLLFGLLLELVVIIPLRVPIQQTPILFIWQDWALGVLYTKIACAVTMMGPDWFLRAAIERAYREGIRDMNLTFIFKELSLPVVTSFGIILAVPYVLAYSIVPMFITSLHFRNLIARRIYPFFLLVASISVIVTFQIRQFRKLYEHIKNDKYLVGQRLVNYDHRKPKSQTPTS